MVNKLFIPISFLNIIAVLAGSPILPEGYTVGCVQCHKLDKNKINIHLVPHSHDDVGWLKTVDEYFYGVNDGLISTELIITSVVLSLKRNPDRRYIQVETAYFNKWWEQNEDLRDDFRELVDNGQIEIVNGAWSMNDEACVNYQSTIDQFTLGLKTIEEKVGKCGRPRIGWQIDPFGHSREHASLLYRMGYDAVFFARLDHDDKLNRTTNGDLNFLWKGSANMDDNIIFASIFPGNLYSEPDYYCWDILCGDNQIVDDIKSPLYNINEKVNNFMAILKRYTSYYKERVKHILIPMGGDFQYQAAEYNFGNMDKLIKAFKNNTHYNLIYSTPSCYLKAVNDAQPNLTLKTDDFFPYSDRDHAFWAGFYTSRPTIKRFERESHNILQATKQMYFLNLNRTYDEKLNSLKEAIGVMQHHDAITGTEQQHVANDYVRQVSAAIKDVEEPIGDVIQNILNSEVKLNLSSCLLTNISICNVSQNSEKFVVVAYNPLAWKTTHYIRLPVETGFYSINGPDGAVVYDLQEPLFNFGFVKIANETPSNCTLIFAAKNIPPLGFKVYHIQKLSNKKPDVDKTNLESYKPFGINETTGLLTAVNLNGISLNLSQNFYFYKSQDGFADDAFVASGAYIFRPTNTTPDVLENATKIREYNGNVVYEVHQKWNNSIADIYQSIRWYKDENYIEFDWIIGDIDIHTVFVGKEIITRYTISDFNNLDTFYTDSNGREMLKRVKNMRPDYTYNISMEPVASNYYPVTSKIVMEDEKLNIRVAILTDRSQGGSSLNKNELELMLHRRLCFDDERGVVESLDEEEFNKGLYARGSHYLVIGPSNGTHSENKTTAAYERILAQKKLVQPWIGLAQTDLNFTQLKMPLEFSAISLEFPENINILTLEPWNETSFLLRFEHIMEKNEDPILSQPTIIPNIQDLFNEKSVVETDLAASYPITELTSKRKYVWKMSNGSQTFETYKHSASSNNITLEPMEIKTFLITKNPVFNSAFHQGFNISLAAMFMLIWYIV